MNLSGGSRRNTLVYQKRREGKRQVRMHGRDGHATKECVGIVLPIVMQSVRDAQQIVADATPHPFGDTDQ